MKHADKTFNQVLEVYLYQVANQTIELADTLTQTAMMDLLIQVSKSADTAGTVVESTSPMPSEWEQVLSQPVDWRSVDQQWLLRIKREHQARNRRYIQRLETVIASTYHRWQQVQMSPLSEARRTRLEAYYEQTLASYQHQLAQIMSVCESI